MEKNRIVFFDQLRGIAILLIIFTHVHQTFNLPIILEYPPRIGQMGCQIFFFISGFFCYRQFANKSDVFRFYKARIKRILPGYWITIVLGVILVSLSEYYFGQNLLGINTEFKNVVPNIFLFNGLIPGFANNCVVRGGWFVGTLAILYLIVPLLSRFLSYRCHPLALSFLVFATALFVILLISYLYPCWECKRNSFVYFSFINQLPTFFLGMALKQMYIKQILYKEKLEIVLGICLLIFSSVLFYIGFSYNVSIVYCSVPFFFSLSVFLFSSYCLSKNIEIKRWGGVFSLWGKVDYAIMLIHPFIVFEFNKLILHYCSVNQAILYLLLLPINFILIFLLSWKYNTLITYLSKKLF